MCTRAAAGRGEGDEGPAVSAGKGGEGLARGEAGDDRVVDVDDVEAAGVAIEAGALVHVKERVTGVPKPEADGARER